MAYEYLQCLGLTEDEQAKVRSLGATTPVNLLSIIQYSPESRESFSTFLGSADNVRKLEAALESIVGPAKTQAGKPRFVPSLGALDPADQPKIEGGDTQGQRDHLVKEIEQLRRIGGQNQAYIAELESQLKDLLKFG